MVIALLLTISASGNAPAQMDPSAPLQLAPIAPGPFQPSLESLRQNRYPHWFTSGKLGIWAHWGPQAVPMEGDWYARGMYEQGNRQYDDHLARYGHPSEFGYKDIIPLWKAEKWDPDRLMALYKKAGARYFVSMGVHHDNFDLWNSTYHRWNAVRMGPKRDVVGTWQKAARKLGLHFGVSEHLGASFTWFQASHGSDRTGPLAGVPYDGADPAYQDLYHQPALPEDTGWYSNDPRWHSEWYRRIKDLVDQYRPDLLYTDGGIPFGSVGQGLVAHFYNSNIAAHGGKQEAVYTCKQPSEGRWAQDLERGVMGGIQPHPWQTDTSIGDWFYNKHWSFRGADWVIQTLVDVVSKNGNLLLNVVLRPDGSLDPEAEKILADMAEWNRVDGESVFDTEPWLVYGEGPIRAKGGAFREDFAFTARDVRFTSKGDRVVYATLMCSPQSRDVTLASLAMHEGDTARISNVSVLGSNEKIACTSGPDGLKLTLPAGGLSKIAVVIKITGRNLRGFKSIAPANPAPVVSQGPDGEALLSADSAEIHGDSLRTEERGGGTNLGYWDSPADWASWTVDFRSAGTYEVTASVATDAQPTSFALEAGGKKLTADVPVTGGWDAYRDVVMGTVAIAKAGKAVVSIRPADPSTWHAMNLRSVRFRMER